MARRPLAGRDLKLTQAHRRDAFFARMRRKGGVPRLPTQAPEVLVPEDEVEQPAGDEIETAEAASGSETADEATPTA